MPSKILDYAPCAYDEEFDRSVSFPIFSGLFVALKMGAIKDDSECSFEKSMCKSFVEQARLYGDPVHYGRALAMEAEMLGRLGKFEDALEIVEQIKPIYNIKTQHEAICKAYGSDRVAQAFSHSVNVYTALGRIEEALNTCKYILEEIIPFSNPKNIHNSFCLLYSVIIVLKENGLSQKAQVVFQDRIIAPFKEYFGLGGSTFSKPLFMPVSVLLELQLQIEPVIETIKEYTKWALDKNLCETSILAQESAFASFSASPFALLGEICFSLGKIHHNMEEKYRLIQKAVCLMEKSDENTRFIAYPNMYAKKKLKIMKTYLEEMSSAGDIYSAMTSQEWTSLGHAESELVAATDDRKLMNVRAAKLLEHHLDRLLKSRNPAAKVTDVIKAQLVKFVDVLSQSYKGAKFHSYSHVLHVTTSMNKLIYFTEIRDPMISFTLVFSALFHDAGHTGEFQCGVFPS
jgi:tetratricopeptide (TPR) repeat protein